MTVWIIQAMKAISQESSQAIPVWQLFNIEMKVKMINLLHNFHPSSPVMALLGTKWRQKQCCEDVQQSESYSKGKNRLLIKTHNRAP